MGRGIPRTEARKRLREAARALRARPGPTPYPSACVNDANEGLKADFLVGPQTPTPRPPPRMGGPAKKCATKGAKRNQARQRPITAEAGGARGENDASITAAKPLTYNGRLAGGPRDASKAGRGMGAGASCRRRWSGRPRTRLRGWAVRGCERTPGSPVPPFPPREGFGVGRTKEAPGPGPRAEPVDVRGRARSGDRRSAAGGGLAALARASFRKKGHFRKDLMGARPKI